MKRALEETNANTVPPTRQRLSSGYKPRTQGQENTNAQLKGHSWDGSVEAHSSSLAAPVKYEHHDRYPQDPPNGPIAMTAPSAPGPQWKPPPARLTVQKPSSGMNSEPTSVQPQMANHPQGLNPQFQCVPGVSDPLLLSMIQSSARSNRQFPGIQYQQHALQQQQFAQPSRRLPPPAPVWGPWSVQKHHPAVFRYGTEAVPQEQAFPPVSAYVQPPPFIGSQTSNDGLHQQYLPLRPLSDPYLYQQTDHSPKLYHSKGKSNAIGPVSAGPRERNPSTPCGSNGDHIPGGSFEEKLAHIRTVLRGSDSDVYIVMEDSNDGYSMGDMSGSTMVSIHRTFDGAFRSLLIAARRSGWMDQIATGNSLQKGHSCEEWLAGLDELQKGQIMEQATLSERYITFDFDDTTAGCDGSAEFMISRERLQD